MYTKIFNCRYKICTIYIGRTSRIYNFTINKNETVLNSIKTLKIKRIKNNINRTDLTFQNNELAIVYVEHFNNI